MATKNVVTKVWIADGCIVCDLCETACGAVFVVEDGVCRIREEAASADVTRPHTDAIERAAGDCPVDVIQFDTETVDIPDEPVAAGDGQVVTKVTIVDGCIVCDLCETACPEVFAVRDGACVVKPEAADAAYTRPRTAALVAAAGVCPVDVIKLETEAGAAPGAGPQKPVFVPPPGVGDPALQAMLAATTARGGRKFMDKFAPQRPVAERIRARDKAMLTADARFARIMAGGAPAPTPGKAPAKAGSTRRGFINAITVGWACVAGVTVLGLAAFQRFMFPNVLEEPDPRVRIGPLDPYRGMAPGSVNEDFKDTAGFWLYRTEERLVAISTTCTHLGCIPNWLENDQKFKCPCHGSGFTPQGVNFEGPAPRPLERFSIRVEDGVVVVDRSKKFLAMGPADTAKWDVPNAFVTV